MLAGLPNTYETKDFENVVTDFTLGCFTGQGVEIGQKGEFLVM